MHDERQHTGAPDLPALVFIGPLPPPVVGQAVTTEYLRDFLTRSGFRLTTVNTAPGPSASVIRAMAVRLARLAAGPAKILTGALSRHTVLYLSVNANLGMLYTAGCALLGRLMGYRIVLHHHSYSHISTTVSRMRVLSACAGGSSLHVVICDEMARQLRARYPSVLQTISLSNVITIESYPFHTTSRCPPYRIGHLSNLSREKGLDTVLALMRRMIDAQPTLQLVLAGSPVDSESAKLIADAQMELGDALDYRGAVYGEAKKAFYRDIDIFLFPTRYRNETQGIVNLEALAAGVPVIANAQCCIPYDLDSGGGLAVPLDGDFIDTAVTTLSQLTSSPESLSRASQHANRRFTELKHQGDWQLHEFCAALRGPGGTAG